MERLSAAHFLAHVENTDGFGLMWHPDDEPVIYIDKHWTSRGYLGPDPATTNVVQYTTFLFRLRMLTGKKYRINKVSQLVDCEEPLVGDRFWKRLWWIIRWGHEIHFCKRPRGKFKSHFGDHECACKKRWPLTEMEKA